MFNEIFFGLQGEGKTVGQPRLFIRFNECNLSCKFCDTKYTWGSGDINISLQQGSSLITQNFYPKWVITGGEPLLKQVVIEELIKIYNPSWVEIETNGTIEPSPYLSYKVDLWNISPKNPTSLIVEVTNDLPMLKCKALKDTIVKFVVKDNNDWNFVYEIKNEYNLTDDKIWIMPETSKDAKETEELRLKIYEETAQKRYNFSPRLHVVMYGPKRGV
jgi:7-carboxy-7-deazaguanine synthase